MGEHSGVVLQVIMLTKPAKPATGSRTSCMCQRGLLQARPPSLSNATWEWSNEPRIETPGVSENEPRTGSGLTGLRLRLGRRPKTLKRSAWQGWG